MKRGHHSKLLDFLCCNDMWFWRVLLVLNFLPQKSQTLATTPAKWVSAWLLMCCLVFAVLPHFKQIHSLSSPCATSDNKTDSRSSSKRKNKILINFKSKIFIWTPNLSTLTWIIYFLWLLYTWLRRLFLLGQILKHIEHDIPWDTMCLASTCSKTFDLIFET